MDTRMLELYETELRHLYEVAWEFAGRHERVGSRLALAPDTSGDPYVKLLLEGVAFLTARIQRQLEDEFPTFTRHLLEMVFPDATAPTPSMMVVGFTPDHRLGDLRAGHRIPAGTRLASRLGPHSDTRCTFVTAHDVELWPIELTRLDYLGLAELAQLGGAARRNAKAAIRVRLKTPDGMSMADLALDRLPLFLPASGVGHRLYQTIVGHGVGIVLAHPTADPADYKVLATAPAGAIARLGMAPEEAMLPKPTRSFDGYRLLREYFAFPERFLFVELGGLGEGVRKAKTGELDVIVLLDRDQPDLQRSLDQRHAMLFATPAINLFERQAGPVPLDRHRREQHVVVDRQHDQDFEIYAIERIEARGGGMERSFAPFFSGGRAAADGFFTTERRPRPLSHQRRRQGPRSSAYRGEDVFVNLVDHATKPWPEQLDRMVAKCLCTNRDLPLHLALEVGAAHFTAEIGAPIASIQRVAGPTPPGLAPARGQAAWDAIRHLGLNYQSLVDPSAGGGVETLRCLLRLHAREAASAADAEALSAVTCERIVRPLPLPGPLTFAHGLGVGLTFDATAFRAGSAFLLGAVLESFLERFLPINSIIETRVSTLDQGDIMRWPTRLGTLPLA